MIKQYFDILTEYLQYSMGTPIKISGSTHFAMVEPPLDTPHWGLYHMESSFGRNYSAFLPVAKENCLPSNRCYGRTSLGYP